MCIAGYCLHFSFNVCTPVNWAAVPDLTVSNKSVLLIIIINFPGDKLWRKEEGVKKPTATNHSCIVVGYIFFYQLLVEWFRNEVMYVCMYVCMYYVRHDIQIPRTRYVAINRLYLYLM